VCAKTQTTRWNRCAGCWSCCAGEYRFNGYIHAKAIPGCSPELVQKLGMLCDRMSVNIEMPSERSLSAFAPNKTKDAILMPMTRIRDGIRQNKEELAVYRHAPSFVPAGQSTQMIHRRHAGHRFSDSAPVAEPV